MPSFTQLAHKESKSLSTLVQYQRIPVEWMLAIRSHHQETTDLLASSEN